MLKFNQTYLGYDIAAELNEDNIVVVDNVKIRITKAISKPSVYIFRMNENKVTLEKQTGCWGMTADQARDLNRWKEKWFANTFGDIIAECDKLHRNKK